MACFPCVTFSWHIEREKCKFYAQLSPHININRACWVILIFENFPVGVWKQNTFCMQIFLPPFTPPHFSLEKYSLLAPNTRCQLKLVLIWICCLLKRVRKAKNIWSLFQPDVAIFGRVYKNEPGFWRFWPEMTQLWGRQPKINQKLWKWGDYSVSTNWCHIWTAQ